MRRSLALALALVALPAAAQTEAAPAGGPAWQSMGAAVAQTLAEDKPMLVYSYVQWCGWCARMDRETFTDAAVLAYLAEHFTATRLDLDSPTDVSYFDRTLSMAALGQAFGIAGTPTTVFVGTDGQPITKLPGFSNAETFLLVLQFVREGAWETETFQQYVDRRNGVPPDAAPAAAPAEAPAEAPGNG